MILIDKSIFSYLSSSDSGPKAADLIFLPGEMERIQGRRQKFGVGEFIFKGISSGNVLISLRYI